MKFKVISIENPQSLQMDIDGRLKLKSPVWNCDKLQSTIVPTFSLEPCNHSKLDKRNKTEEIGQQP